MAAEPKPYLYKLERPLTRNELLDQLADVPAGLRELVSEASPMALTRSPGDESWSAFQTLCHMRDAALVYSVRFRWMVFDDDPLLPNYDENNWVAAAKDVPGDVAEIVEEIAASRRDLVRVLTRLPEEAWARAGRHEVAGTIVLEHYVRHQLAHEEQHLRQVRAALGAG